MKVEDLVQKPPPSTYREAEAILQKLAGGPVEAVWASMTEEDAEALLRSLMPSARTDDAVCLMDFPSDSHCPYPSEPIEFPAGEPAPSTTPRNLPRLSERTLIAILETAPDAIVVIDSQGVIVQVNAQTEKMFGYHRSELLGQKVEILVPTRNRGRHVHQRRGFFANPRGRSMGSGLTLFGLRKDGREFPVEISLSPVETEEGLLVTSAIRDVTEAKRHEAQLRRAEARYRSLVEEIPAVTFMAAFDEGESEIYVSPQIVNMLGFTQEEWVNDPVLWHRQLHPEDRERWHHEFARTCATAEPFRSEYRFVARDGRTVWVLGEAKVVHDRDGRPMFLQGVAFDITGMKKAEEELQLLNRTLNDRVTEKTAALERSNEALANFGDRAAHDIQKPLDNIQYVIDGPADPSRPQDPADIRLKNIGTIVVDAKKLVQGMLAFALVSKEAKEITRTDCAVLVREVRNELQKVIRTSRAVVSFQNLPTVLVHRESLKSVFRNLIDNAIKYRGDRPLKVRVTAQRRENAWQFSVKDNGMGIPRHPRHRPETDYWTKIFGLGQRHHTKSPTGEKIPGFGIGLSYCQRVIEYYGGRIWVESEIGKGSTFFFTLPLSPAKPT